MKKLLSFFAAALLSVSMFADPNIVTPTISGETEFTDSVIVTMSCPSQDADIYYTVDGVTSPTCDCPNAPEYTHPIVIKETTTIKAAAFDGNDWSSIAEVTFTKVPAPADPNREYFSLDPSTWGWGYNSVSGSVEGGLQTTITSDYGAVSMGWEPTRDLSEWDKIVFEISYMENCAGEWWKLKAYLRDEVDAESKQMEGFLGLDAPDNQLNYLVIDLHQQVEGFDLTKARVLAVQCEPTGGIFTISSAYLLKEDAGVTAKYYIVGNMTNWEVNENYEMNPSLEAETEEYFYGLDLTTASQFKVVKVEGETQTWYPDGMGNNYGEHGEIERDGEYTIYFRPNMDGGEAWFYNCILATRHTEPERVFVGFLFPENGMPANGISMLGSFIDGTVELSYVEETGGYMHDHIMAVDEDKFYLRATDDVDNFLFAYVDGAWDMAEFTFDEEWEQDTWKGDPVKMIDLDLSDNSKYAWQKAIPEGLDEVQGDKAESRKVMIDGMLYIVRDGKMYNVLGAEVK